jgi:hypothetical protein
MHSLVLLAFLLGQQTSGVTVTYPADNALLTSPFSISAAAGTCQSQSTVSMGYSLDASTHTSIVTGRSMHVPVVSSSGQHILHVKSWGAKGAACVADLHIKVLANEPAIPDNVTVESNLQRLADWSGTHDPDTPGTSSGASRLVAAPSRSGLARAFSMSYTQASGQRFFTSFGVDAAATHFLYSAWIRLEPSSSVANIEMDLNQVLDNGNTVIYGVQCDGYSGTWDYTINAGSPTAPIDRWIHSNLRCNPREWSRGTWHRVQLSYSRNAAGAVTYESVWLDGVRSDFEKATANSAFALGWSPTLITNFQLDGDGAEGTISAELDNLTIYRW